MIFTFWARLNPWLAIRILNQKIEAQRMDLTALKTAFSTFSTDFGTFRTDVTAKLAALQANQTDPQNVSDIGDITSALGTLDDTVKQMDAALNPAT